MKLYLTAAGIYAGTQAEAKRDGKGWRPEEVPTSKYELIDYLNALKHNSADATERLPAPPMHMSTPVVEVDKPRGPAPGREGYRLFSAGDSVDSLCDAIGELEGSKLAAVSEAFIDRFKELAKRI